MRIQHTWQWREVSLKSEGANRLEIMAATMDDLPSFLKQTILPGGELRHREVPVSSSGPSVAHLTGIQEKVRDERDDVCDEKQARSPPSHPPYIDMIIDAIKVGLNLSIM